MRLICPRCGAQYEIDDSAIPAGGRDVECSACEHVWREPGRVIPFDPAARPVLNRPLNESILSVLREEAARELAQRAAEPQPHLPPAPPSADILAGKLVAMPDTVSPYEATPLMAPPEPAPPSDELAGDAAEEPSQPMPAPVEPAPIPAPAAPVMAPPVSATPALAPALAPVSAPTPAPAPPPRRARRGAYRAGFGVAAMLACTAVGAYALAPRLAGQGELGARLMEFRAEADQARLWLRETADDLWQAARETADDLSQAAREKL